MRRLLPVLWAGLLVLVLGVVVAPSATAAGALPPGPYLWAATADKVLVYSEDHPETPVLSHSSQANGNLAAVNSQTGKVVLVPTLAGIDLFDATAPDGALTFTGASGGYRQVAAIESWASVGSPQIYGLRSAGTAIDVFVGDPSGPSGTVPLRGTATYMSPARPVLKDQILVNVKENGAPNTYSLAVVNTHDNSIRYLTQGSNQLVNGIVWSPDGSHAYLSSTNPDGTGGFVATYTASTSSVSRAPLAAHQAAKQLVVSPDGSRLFVAAVDTVSGQGSYQIISTANLTTVGSVDLFTWATFGYGDVGPEGYLAMPPGPDSAQFGAMQIGSTRDGGDSQLQFFDGSSRPFIAALTVTLPSQFAFISGFDQKTYPGLPFPTPAEVVVLDGAGRPVADQQVTFSIDNNAATITGWGSQALLVTDSKGEIVLPQIVAGPTPGPVSLTASTGSLKPITLPLTIVPAATPPSVTALTAGDGEVTVTFDPGNGNGIAATSYTVTAYNSSTGKPAGVSATGPGSPIRVTGLTNGNSYTFTVTASSPVGSWTSGMSAAINAGVAASITGTPPAGEVGKPYTFTYTVTGAPTPTVTFDNDATPLPAGLTFDASTSTISGTPTAAGSSYVSVYATNAVGTSENDATIVINPGTSLGGSEPTPTAPPASSAPTPSSGVTASPAPTASTAQNGSWGSSGRPHGDGSAYSASAAGSSGSRASSALAATGTPVVQIVCAATVLILLGAVLLVARRTRRRGAATGGS